MIKSNFTLLGYLLLGALSFLPAKMKAQHVPWGINYQAAVSDEYGKPISKKLLTVQITIHKEQPAGEIVWQEGHQVMTDNNGIFSLVIGKGTNTYAGSAPAFQKINWAEGPYFMEIKTDFGSGLKDMGSFQLQSVPYSFVADTALNAPIPRLAHLVDVNKNGLRINQALKWDGYQWVPGDSLLTDFLFITGDLKTGRNVIVLSDLNVSDSIYGTTLKVKKIDADTADINANAFVKNNLTVNHNVRVNNDVYIDSQLIVKGDVYVIDTTKTSSLITDWADITNMQLNNNATIGNNLDVLNNLSVTKTITSDSDIYALSDIYVKDSITSFSLEAVRGYLDSLTVRVDAVIGNNLNVSHNLTVSHDFKLSNNAFLRKNLYVSDSLTTSVMDGIKGDFDTLNVNIDAQVGNNIYAGHNIRSNNDLKVDNNAFVKSDLYVNDSIVSSASKANYGHFDELANNGNMTVGGDLTVANDLFIADTTQTTNLISVNIASNSLNVANNAVVANMLTVNADASLNADLYVADSITAQTFDGNKGKFNTLEILQDASIGNHLTVGGNTKINGTLALASGTSVNKISTDVTFSGRSDNTLMTEKAIYDFVTVKEAQINDNLDVDSAYLYSLIVNNKSNIDEDSAYTYNLLGATHGTVTADKALIVDINKDISGFRNVTVGGDLAVQGNFSLASGASVNEISSDVSLGANSNNILPTQKATKTYIDNLTSTLSNNAVLRNGTQTLTANWDAGNFSIKARSFESTQATGIAPFVVASSTKVTQLNADLLDDKDISDLVLRDGSQSLTANWDAGNYTITAKSFVSNVATGTSPFTVTSTTKVSNLNADLLDDIDIQDLVLRDGSNKMLGNLDLNYQRVVSLRTPVLLNDAANKRYVDSIIRLDSIWKKNGTDIYFNAGKLGIGVTKPVAGLHIKNKTLLVEGASGSFPVTSSQTRFFWSPAYKALRGGTVTNNNWEESNTGTYSLSIGFNTRAKGNYSVALGNNAIADTTGSISFGNATTNGVYAMSTGFSVQASGDYSFASGYNSIASGNYSVALGKNSTATGSSSFVSGENNSAAGQYSFAMGLNSSALGDASMSLGSSSIASGNYSITLGKNSKASKHASVAIGDSSVASGFSSLSFGFRDTASAPFSNAIGFSSKARGKYATAIGENNLARGLSSLALGSNSSALADYSTSLGYNTLVSAQYGLAGGIYNDSIYNALFIIGNGDNTLRHNALILYKNGNMTISGTLTENSDVRLKKNIHPMESVLDKLMKIRPVYYEFKNQKMYPSGVQIGLLAQDVQNQFPQLVERDSRGYLSVSYSRMTAVLIQAIREQQKTIEDLRVKYEELQRRLEQLENQ